jgi:hypothetical protein
MVLRSGAIRNCDTDCKNWHDTWFAYVQVLVRAPEELAPYLITRLVEFIVFRCADVAPAVR